MRVPGIIPAQAKDVELPFVELREVPGGPFPSLSCSLGWQQEALVHQTLPRFVSAAILLRVLKELAPLLTPGVRH